VTRSSRFQPNNVSDKMAKHLSAQMSIVQMSVVQMTVGQMSDVQMTVGQMSDV
jgi:hypothetical protein